MADIVERLRKWQHICSDAAWDDLSEAADEIERLRALIANAPCPGDTIQIKECVARGKCGCDLGAALTNGER